jgi:molybdate transport system permease protein
MIDWTPFFLSFKLAFFTTLFLFIIALPIAWWLSWTNSKVKPFVEAVTALPIVLPPSVLGFYLLVLFSPNSDFGRWLRENGIELIFTFEGLVVASILYSFPFMVQPLQSGFESLPKSMIEASYIAGKGKIETLLKVALPNIKSSLLTAIIITFAHTIGEFGVVLMVGGSIPGETKVASVAIYELVEIMDYDKAHIYSGIMVLISFLILIAVYIFNRRFKIAKA